MPKEMALSHTRKYSFRFTALLLSFYYLCRICREINLTTADLGRHIANGKWVFRDFRVFTSNYYSYTFPDFPFVNHHWGTGALFNGVHQLFGFEGLSILFAAAGLSAFLLTLKITVRQSGSLATLGAALIALPLLTYRTEVRPEGLSICLAAIFYSILSHWKASKRVRDLLWLPLLMVVWTNLHVCFIFGFVILGAFFLESLLPYLRFRKANRLQELQQLSLCLFLSMIATLINPLGPKLSLAPFQSFLDYGYKILENQSVLFILNFGWYFIVIPFFAVTVSIGAGILYLLNQARKKVHSELITFSTLIIGVTFLILSTFAIRNFPFLGLFSIPLIANCFKPLENSNQKEKPFFLRASHLLILTGLIYNALYLGYLSTLGGSQIGIGLEQQNDSSARFFKDHKLKGPIFNNYDIGSFLIYSLFPEEKVFVDNRPEAYPSTFFEKTYVPMQENETRWRMEDAKYQFNVIYFAWHDYTPAAQTFLARRIKDPEWVPVFVDPFALILVKNNNNNRAIIEQFQIPRDRFITHQ